MDQPERDTDERELDGEVGSLDHEPASERRHLVLRRECQHLAAPEQQAGRKPEPQAMPPPIEQRPAHTGSGPLKLCARRIYEGRKRRSAHFGQQMFNEPAWEMLLILYLEDSGERQLQARLVELSGASRSTGNRWIDFLVRKGLAKREEHPTDKRRNFVTLSEKGRTLLELYLSETCGKDREA